VTQSDNFYILRFLLYLSCR